MRQGVDTGFPVEGGSVITLSELETCLGGFW